METKDQIQQKYIIEFFQSAVESNDTPVRAEDIYYISQNHKPNHFVDQHECDTALKNMVIKKIIDPTLIAFDQPSHAMPPPGHRIQIKGDFFTVISSNVVGTQVRFHLRKESDNAEVFLIREYNKKTYYFRHDPSVRFKGMEIDFSPKIPQSTEVNITLDQQQLI